MNDTDTKSSLPIHVILAATEFLRLRYKTFHEQVKQENR